MMDIKTEYEALKKRCWSRSKKAELIEGLRVLQRQAKRENADAWRLFLNARIADEEERWDDALTVHEELIPRFIDSTDAQERFVTACALINKGYVLGQQGKPDEGIRAYDDVVKRFGEAKELELRERVATALVNKGIALIKQGKPDETILVSNDVVERFGEAEETALKVQVAKVLINKGVALERQGKPDEAVKVYDDVVERFGEAEEIELKELVAWALVNKGITLGQRGKPDEAIKVFEQVVERFGKAEELEFRVQVARALINKGYVFGEQGKPDEAVKVYNDVVERFGEAEEPELKVVVARAVVYKAETLVTQGKVEEARQAVARSVEICPDDEFIKQRAFIVLESVSHEGEDTPETSAPGVRGTVSLSVKDIVEGFTQKERDDIRTEIEARKKRTEKFLGLQSHFPEGEDTPTLFFDLREWNSYTPAVPDRYEVDRGGGYFIRYKGQGIVVDPGYDFLKNFGAAGGRIVDIDHVVITHAHDDHTQDFESILSLLYQHNEMNKRVPPKRVHLYLSQGVGRKFSGLLQSRDVPHIGKTEVLNQGSKERPQMIQLHGLPGAELTVLRAFHDDVITKDGSVGLAFQFDFEKEKKTVVFTGDTGLFPPKLDADGEEVLDTDPEGTKALFHEYPEQFLRPNLLVPHIGSVKREELKEDFQTLSPEKEMGESLYFYPNHLGLRGRVCAIVS